MTATLKRTIARGICPVCKTSQKLQADGTIGGHPALRGLPNAPRCPGKGMVPKGGVTKSEADLAKAIQESYEALPKHKKGTLTFDPPAVPANAVGQTYVAVLLDSSGSMRSIKPEAINAYNELIKPLRKKDDDYHVSFYTFASEVDCVFTDRKPSSLPKLDHASYTPGGTTALHGAICEAVDGFKFQGSEDDAYLVLVVTDGESACDTRSSADARKAISQAKATGRYTFATSCPAMGRDDMLRLGFPEGNITVWDQTKAGAEDMGKRNSQAVASFTRARDAGAQSVANFYTVNVGRKSVDEVKAALTPADRGDYRVIVASKACEIKEAVEAKGLPYYPGCAYYELTKPEKLASHKCVALEMKVDGSKRSQLGPLYANDGEVRQVLGLGPDGKIQLGNPGEWVVWIQSTSLNRKLLAKSRVLYRKR